jgi:hypothetical protein
MLSMVPRSWSFPLLAMSSMTPGCGNSATSGKLLPWTRVRISVSKDCAASVALILIPEDCSNSFSDATNPFDWSPPKPNMTSTCLSPPPPLPPALPPLPPPSLRQPAATSAIAAARVVAWTNLRHRISTPFR